MNFLSQSSAFGLGSKDYFLDVTADGPGGVKYPVVMSRAEAQRIGSLYGLPSKMISIKEGVDISPTIKNLDAIFKEARIDYLNRLAVEREKDEVIFRQVAAPGTWKKWTYPLLGACIFYGLKKYPLETLKTAPFVVLAGAVYRSASVLNMSVKSLEVPSKVASGVECALESIVTAPKIAEVGDFSPFQAAYDSFVIQVGRKFHEDFSDFEKAFNNFKTDFTAGNSYGNSISNAVNGLYLKWHKVCGRKPLEKIKKPSDIALNNLYTILRNLYDQTQTQNIPTSLLPAAAIAVSAPLGENKEATESDDQWRQRAALAGVVVFGAYCGKVMWDREESGRFSEVCKNRKAYLLGEFQTKENERIREATTEIFTRSKELVSTIINDGWKDSAFLELKQLNALYRIYSPEEILIIKRDGTLTKEPSGAWEWRDIVIPHMNGTYINFFLVLRV